MDPLDAARRLTTHEPVCDNANWCHWCGAGNVNNWTHDPDCPFLAMPQIVKVIEAAQAIAAKADPTWPYFPFNDYNQISIDMDLIDALVEALKGDPVPA